MRSPARIFDGCGESMDGRQRKGLAAIELLRAPFRAVFCDPNDASDLSHAPVSWVWMLDDDATFAAFSHCVVAAAIGMVLDGRSVLIAGNNFESVRDVLAGLKDAKARGVGLAEREQRRLDEEGAWARRMAKVMA